MKGTKHLSYHERHSMEEMARLRGIRLQLAQTEKQVERQPATAQRDDYLDATRRTRSDVERAIVALKDQEYHVIYEQLRRAQTEARGLPFIADEVRDELDEAISDWRPK